MSGGKRLEVTVKVNAKKNGKAIKTKKLSLKVKVVNASLTASATTTSIAVGQTTAISTKSVPSTAVVSYSSSDEKVATVSDAGVVTGVAAGTATITATSDYGKSATVDVTVATIVLKDATQTESNKIVATIVGDTSSLKAGDFAITNTSTKATVAVKSVTAVKNTTDKFTIETFTEMKDAKTYTVAYGGVEVSFTATDGTVASVGLSKTEVPAATKTEVQLTTIDANGVILDYFDLHTDSKGKGDVTSKTTFTKGYIEGNYVYLPSVGDTVSVAVTYHTGTFGTDGTETGNIEGTFTVTAVDPSTVNYNYAVTVSDSAPAWKASSFVASSQIKLGAERNAYFYITDENGTEITNYSDYKVESADKTKLIVKNTPLSGKSTAVSVNGVSEGTSYIIIKKNDSTEATVASLPVTIVAAPVATTLEFSKDSVTVAKNAGVIENIDVTVKDQYGDKIETVTSVAVDAVLGAPTAAAKLLASIGDISTTTSQLSIVGTTYASNDVGTYTYRIKAVAGSKTLTRSFAVVVVKNEDAKSYELRFSKSSVDTTIGTGTVTPTATDIKITVATMTNGGAKTELDQTAGITYVIKNSDGVQVNKDAATYADYASACWDNESAVDGSYVVQPITLKTGTTSTYDKNLAAGTYTVTATFDADGDGVDEVTVPGSFTITDSQDKKASFEIVDNKLVQGTTKISIAAAFGGALNDKSKKFVKVYYDGIEQGTTDDGTNTVNTVLSASDIISVKGTTLTTSDGGAYIKTVKMYVTVSGSNNKVPVTLTVNDQFASCDATGIN